MNVGRSLDSIRKSSSFVWLESLGREVIEERVMEILVFILSEFENY